MFRLCYNKQTNKKPTWSRSRASSEKSLLCMSMSSRASKSKSMIKKLNEKKNCFVWMFRIDLKKQTNYCDKKQKENKKQFTQNQSDSKCHCGVLTRKIKRPVTIALPYPPPLHQKWRKTKNQITKKNNKSKSKAKFFMFFQQHLQKDELFSFWWPYLCPPF